MTSQPLTTCLWFDDQAGTVMLVEFELNGQRFTGLNGGPQHFGFNEAVSFCVTCADQAEVDYYWEALLDGGGEPSVCGWLKDRYGVRWQVVPQLFTTMVRDSDQARKARVTAAMLSMVKFDIAGLERAYAGD